jgi:transglutaminase-like putative cysteine protease
MRPPFVSSAMSLLLLCAAAAAAASAESPPSKPYAPGWKYRTYHVRTDVQRDGTTTTHYELAYTALAESALQSLNEQSITYHEHDGRLEDVVAYTLKPDGTHIDVPETNVQVTSRNGVNGAAPAFSDFMTRHLVYPNVEVGDTVYLSYTLRDVKPSFRNYYSLLTHLSDTSIYDDAQIVVTAPASLGLKQKSFHLDPPKVTRLDQDRRQWTWTYRNAVARDTRKEQSLFDRAWKYDDMPTIEMSNFADWKQIAAAYEEEAARRATVTQRIRKLADEITQGAANPRERAERTYRWVSKEITFAGNCLTGGDVVPRDTDLILNMKMGDCKDHATLMQALLAAQGIRSTQVLINAQEMGYTLPDVPCWQAFNHVMNYLPEFDLYFDATSSHNPFGTLPEQDRGKPVIHTAQFDGIRHTPARAFDANFGTAVQSVSVSVDGSMDVDASYRVGGDLANSMSKQFHDWKASPEFDGGADVIRRSIEGMGYAGSGSYTAIEGADGPAETFAYGMKYHVAQYLDTEDPHGIELSGLFPSPSPVSALISYAAAQRYAHDFFCHGDIRSEELTLTLPDNVHLLAIPHDVHAKTALLEFDASYARDGNRIHVKRSVIDRSPGPICTPDVAEQYARIGAAVKKDAKAQAVYEPK